MTDCRRSQANKRPSLMTRLLLRMSVGRCVDGLWIGCYDNDHSEASLRRVEEALHLIKTYDRRRYERLIRDLKRVWVVVIIGGVAQFDHSIWACMTRDMFLMKQSLRRKLPPQSFMKQPTPDCGTAASDIKKKSVLGWKKCASAANGRLQPSFRTESKSTNWRTAN